MVPGSKIDEAAVVRLRKPTGTWKLTLDSTRCSGHGICVLHCPDLVTLDEWGFAGVDRTPFRNAAVLRRARRAAAACPESALALYRLDPQRPNDLILAPQPRPRPTTVREVGDSKGGAQ